jgi:hypothetical protein
MHKTQKEAKKFDARIDKSNSMIRAGSWVAGMLFSTQVTQLLARHNYVFIDTLMTQ